MRDALAALFLCVFALAAAASPTFDAARSFEQVGRVASSAAAFGAASKGSSEPVVTAARAAVAERAGQRPAAPRHVLGTLGPALAPAGAPSVGAAVGCVHAPDLDLVVVVVARTPEAARARGPPVAG